MKPDPIKLPLDKEAFARGLGILADRAGRKLAGPTIAELYLAAESLFDTETWAAAVHLWLRHGGPFIPALAELRALVRPREPRLVRGLRALVAAREATAYREGSYWLDRDLLERAGVNVSAARSATRAIGGSNRIADTATDRRLADSWADVYLTEVERDERAAEVYDVVLGLHRSPILAGLPDLPPHLRPAEPAKAIAEVAS